jgi:hypothetical protein
MDRADILSTLQRELLRHQFDTFVINPPFVAQSGSDVVVPGCTFCKKRLHTTLEFLHHLVFHLFPKVVCGRHDRMDLKPTDWLSTKND